MKIFIEIAYDKSDYTHKLEAIGINGKDERRLVGVQVTEIRFFRHRVKGSPQSTYSLLLSYLRRSGAIAFRWSNWRCLTSARGVTLGLGWSPSC